MLHSSNMLPTFALGRWNLPGDRRRGLLNVGNPVARIWPAVLLVTAESGPVARYMAVGWRFSALRRDLANNGVLSDHGQRRLVIYYFPVPSVDY